MNNEELTYGEKAVGLEFYLSRNIDVLRVKDSIAGLLNQLYHSRSKSNDPEIQRMLSLAITDLQTAQMWVVKALKWQE